MKPKRQSKQNDCHLPHRMQLPVLSVCQPCRRLVQCCVLAVTHETPFYGELNASLRSKNRSDVKPFFLYMKLMLSALHRLPLGDGSGGVMTVYRGVHGLLKSECACRDMSMDFFPKVLHTHAHNTNYRSSHFACSGSQEYVSYGQKICQCMVDYVLTQNFVSIAIATNKQIKSAASVCDATEQSFLCAVGFFQLHKLSRGVAERTGTWINVANAHPLPLAHPQSFLNFSSLVLMTVVLGGHRRSYPIHDSCTKHCQHPRF